MGVNTSGNAILEEELFTEDMSEFERAGAVVSSGKYHMSDGAVDGFPSDNMQKLALYGLYKQATKGDVKDPCPSSFDMVGFAKWNSWNSYRGTSKELVLVLSFTARDAEEKYIDFVNKLLSNYSPSDEGNSLDSSFGMKVSTMQIGYGLCLNMMQIGG